MNLLYFMLVFKECKIGYSNVIANVTQRLLENVVYLRLMVKFCVALSNMLQLESVSLSLGYQNLILK